MNDETKLTRDGKYPLADRLDRPSRQMLCETLDLRMYVASFGGEQDNRPHVEGFVNANVRAMWTGEIRPPKKGEWYLSGSTIAAWRASNDLSSAYHIAKLVIVERRVIETTKPLPTAETVLE